VSYLYDKELFGVTAIFFGNPLHKEKEELFMQYLLQQFVKEFTPRILFSQIPNWY